MNWIKIWKLNLKSNQKIQTKSTNTNLKRKEKTWKRQSENEIEINKSHSSLPLCPRFPPTGQQAYGLHWPAVGQSLQRIAAYNLHVGLQRYDLIQAYGLHKISLFKILLGFYWDNLGFYFDNWFSSVDSTIRYREMLKAIADAAFNPSIDGNLFGVNFDPKII